MFRGNKYEQMSKKWFKNSESYYSFPYKARCLNCGKPHELLTQEDDQPEYFTSIALKCSACGGLVYFSLPVN